jgi:hypothetical protein
MIVTIVGRTVDKMGRMASAGTGKDTVADLFVSEHHFAKVAFADPMKRFLMEVYGFTKEQLWGPSDLREVPDKRFPRRHTFEGDKCACCGAFYYEERGWSAEQCFLTPRYALQQLGTEWGRDCYDETWVSYGMSQANALLSDPRWSMYVPEEGVVQRVECQPQGEFHRDDEPEGDIEGVVFSDARFPNEIRYVKERGGKAVLVVRHVERLKQVRTSHPSENSLTLIDVDSDLWDYVLFNDSLDRLQTKAASVLAGLRNGGRGTV